MNAVERRSNWVDNKAAFQSERYVLVRHPTKTVANFSIKHVKIG